MVEVFFAGRIVVGPELYFLLWDQKFTLLFKKKKQVYLSFFDYFRSTAQN